jgi:hypothetical protein
MYVPIGVFTHAGAFAAGAIVVIVLAVWLNKKYVL